MTVLYTGCRFYIYTQERNFTYQKIHEKNRETQYVIVARFARNVE